MKQFKDLEENNTSEENDDEESDDDLVPFPLDLKSDSDLSQMVNNSLLPASLK